ncbi:hypothetical protein IW261DRAFT_1412799 [Armillaria novae-zelandiae]|uniref:Uncharacterized protein n=1 Tax=Armillaria novae-zelandiae TaxID=153914 RepID=A0AA39PTF3_9AGAR|nr:hypothetical protein IW261DRAFT_1412799 [Armillaria novae-zelandiae]
MYGTCMVQSHKGQLPACSHLNLERIHRLDLKLDDANDVMSPMVRADLFEWWRAAWVNSKSTTDMEELTITTLSVRSPRDGNYHVTVWTKIGATLSRPAWVGLSALSIVVLTCAHGAENELYLYKDAIQHAMNGSSVNTISIVFSVAHIFAKTMPRGFAEEQEDVVVDYSD